MLERDGDCLSLNHDGGDGIQYHQFRKLHRRQKTGCRMFCKSISTGAANPQIAYDKEFAKTSISTAELSQIRSQIDKILRLQNFYSRKSAGFASITFL
jgi:hypothetical protein